MLILAHLIGFVQRGRIARAEIEVFFTDILFSEDVGLYKPDPRFFLLACKRLKLPVYEILCIWDSPSADIRGAKLAGIDAC